MPNSLESSKEAEVGSPGRKCYSSRACLRLRVDVSALLRLWCEAVCAEDVMFDVEMM